MWLKFKIREALVIFDSLSFCLIWSNDPIEISIKLKRKHQTTLGSFLIILDTSTIMNQTACCYAVTTSKIGL